MKKDYVPVAEQPRLKAFRVYVEQVNQTMIEVHAKDADEARDKGYAKWRRDYAHSRVLDVEKAG